MGNKKSSFAPRDHSLEDSKHSPHLKHPDTSTNLSIDGSLGSGRGFKPNTNFTLKKSLGSNKTGSQTRLNALQSPRSPNMLKKQDDTSVQIGVAESSAEEQYILMDGENTSSATMVPEKINVQSFQPIQLLGKGSFGEVFLV